MDLTERIIDKLDILDEKIDNLCVWKTRMETEWKNHMEEADNRQKSKERNFYYILAIMGTGFTVFELLSIFL